MAGTLDTPDMKRSALSTHVSFYASLVAALILTACATPQPATPQQPAPPVVVPPAPQPGPVPAPPTPVPAPPQPPVPLAQLRPVDWGKVAAWGQDTLADSWPAFLQTCQGLKNQTAWQASCIEAQKLNGADEGALRAFIERSFQPYEVFNPDNTVEGTITGYYEPLLKGDRVRTSKARFPVYAPPDDLIVIDLASVYPELKNMRLRGRLQGNKVVPYYTRAEIENANGNFKGKPIAYAEDPVDLFFLHIQGSGRIELPDGSHLRVGYADQNGYPYKSIGKILVDRGDLKLEQASMQGIKAWGVANPDKLQDLLNSNPSHVFFKELPNGLSGPLGALGVPLTSGRSIAIDPKYIPLGAPVFLSTTWPNSSQPLNRLMLAQDTGGAIRGSVRADFFWGFGADAGEQAGKMKQKGRMWVLLPKDYPAIQTANNSR
jgi:membrane-bound lytic murein transglycosylase A